MSRLLSVIDDLNINVAIVTYLAEKEDEPGLSNILERVSSDLALIRCELESIRKEEVEK